MSDKAHNWSDEEVVGVLGRVDVFEGLPHEDLMRVAGIATGAVVEPGEMLFEEGDPGDAFYVVLKGRVEIVKSLPDGSEEKLAVRRIGEAFGEMALLDDAPRTTTARAVDATQLVVVEREAFQGLFGSDPLALRLTAILSRALRALGVRFASVEKIQDTRAPSPPDANAISRVMHVGLLPRTAPQMDGYDVAAGTTTEESGRGASVWDWIDMSGGRVALLTLDVRQDGFPPAYHLGTARAVLRALAAQGLPLADVLARANDALSGSAVEGLDQFIDVGILAGGVGGIEWASAGRVPGGIIRRDGSFEELGAHGPPLGMMSGFEYDVRHFEMSVGDTVFVLSHAPPGLFLGAADLVAQLHGKPAGEVVATLHKAIRKAQGETRAETSVLYARKH